MASLFYPMNRSENEIIGMATKAARGAGYPTGLAEEMARAAFWLCQNRFDGVGVLISELRSESGPVQYETTAAGITLSGASTACLAVCGMDGLAAGISQQAILIDVHNPLMLLGICATASVEMQTGVKLDEWANIDQGDVISMKDELPVGDYALKLCDCKEAATEKSNNTQLDIASHRWSVLEALAARTYVPASAESRASGAGAGLTDND